MQYNYEWDFKKAHTNARKHGVTFKDACKIFEDPMAITIFDDDESLLNEDRWVTIGQINGRHYLVVLHTEQHYTENIITIRVISARPANKQEIQQYQRSK